MNFLIILVLVSLPFLTFCYEISIHQKAALPPLNFGARADFSLNGLAKENVCQNPSKYVFTQRAGTNKYYGIADIMMRWIEGENYCQSFGAHLPVPKNIDDLNFFRWFVGPKVMKPSTGLSSINSAIGGYWLGGYRSAETNNFKRVDNSPFSFTNWAPGQPDNGGQMENFIHDIYIINQLKYTGWNDEDWYVHYWVVCELNC